MFNKASYQKEYVNKNRKKIEAYYRKWYKKNGRNRAIDYQEAILEWQKKYPEKVKAQRIARTAIRNGTLIKSKVCIQCKRRVRCSGHHSDYTKPLEVMWLCSSCHKIIHRTEGANESREVI